MFKKQFGRKQNPSKGYVSLLFVTIAGFLLVFQFSSSLAYASPSSSDPLVIILADKTPGSSCTETFQANIGTSQASVTQIPCPFETFMSDVFVHRSQAIVQHKAYIMLPSLQQSSLAVRQQVLKQLQTFNNSGQAEFWPQMSRHAQHPSTACGNSGSASLRWNYSGGVFNASISFTKSSDCSSAFFGDSQLNTATSPPFNNPLWEYDLYAGNQYNVPGCPAVGPVGHHFHLVSQSAPTGYYYENYLNFDSPCLGENLSWDNIGPIN